MAEGIPAHTCRYCGQHRISLESMEDHVLIHNLPRIDRRPPDLSSLTTHEMSTSEFRALRLAAMKVFGAQKAAQKMSDFLQGKHIILKGGDEG